VVYLLVTNASNLKMSKIHVTKKQMKKKPAMLKTETFLRRLLFPNEK